MSFDELWNEIKSFRVLPEAACLDLPRALSEDTKNRLSKRNPKDVAEIFMDAITAVNHGSVETLDSLVKRHL